jgi:protein-disulfide isomerase
VEPELAQRYIEDGALRIEWRDFPYLGEESRRAARAARAAGEQGQFWDYHDLLYENQGSVDSGAFSDENLIGFAEELELDVARFEEDLQSEELAAALDADFRAAQDEGIQGTPSFDVNGRTLVGPQPLEAFEQVIAEELQNG